MLQIVNNLVTNLPFQNVTNLVTNWRCLTNATYQIEQIVQRTILEDKLKKQKKNV